MPEKPSRPTSRSTPAGLLTGLTEKLSELEVSVGRQSERFRGVLEIGTAITSAQDIEELLRLVMDKLTALLGAEASTLFMLDEKKQELWSRVLRGSTLKEIRIPATMGIVGGVVASGKTLLLADAYEDVRFNPDIDRQSGFRTRSVIAAPLRHVSGRLLGVVEVLHRRVDAFNADDQALVEAVASQVAAVIDNVKLLQELRGQNEKLLVAGKELAQAVQDLDVLYEVERAVSASVAVEDLLDRVLAKAITVTGAKAAGALLLSDRHELFFARHGLGEAALKTTPLKSPRGIALKVARTGTTVRLEAAEGSPDFDRGLAKKLGVDPNAAILCVPIEGEEAFLGALKLWGKEGGFDESDERMAILLAGQTGRAIDRRRAKEEGERGARLAAIGQMLSGVLHDLRTPMTVISGYAELMAAEEDPEQRRQSVEIIQKQFAHINAMTRETLAFARGERQLLPRKIYLQNFIKEVQDYLKQDFEGTNVELKVVVGYAGAAKFDENKMKRVIYNIARNAAQAMLDGGRFTFSVDREGDELLLRFADTGSGIAPEIADRLFQSFVTSGKEEGTGLGLAVVRQIVEEHGGGVSFRTKAGKGTTFEVRLPVGLPRD